MWIGGRPRSTWVAGSAPQAPLLDYRNVVEDRRALDEQCWERVADVIVPVAFWGFFGVIVAAFLGAVVLWGVLISLAA